MASVTLEELLDNSGISALKGDTEKTASVSDDQPDLVSALRKCAESTEESDPNIRAAAEQELAEKTAEILVIRQTLDEIEKVASIDFEPTQQMKVATFIKAALDSGHSETEIAKFIKKAFVGRAIRAGKDVVQSVKRPLQRAAERFSDRVKLDEARILRQKIKSAPPQEVQKHLDKLEGLYGREKTVKVLQAIKNEGTWLPGPAAKMLPKGGGETYKFTSPGGKVHEISKRKARKYLGIGGGAAGGVAVAKAAGGKSDKQKRGGVTVVST